MSEDKGKSQREQQKERMNALEASLPKAPLQTELFHSVDNEPFATWTVGDHRETWPLRSQEFEHLLRFQFYTMFRDSLPDQILKKIVAQLVAQAQFEGPTLPVFTRIGESGGEIFVDLCDWKWRVVRIDRDGWRVLDDAPVKFIRMPGMAALPLPNPQGSIGELWEFVNLEEDDRVLFVACLIGDFHPRGPYPITVMCGEHGSGKTTLSRIRRALVDPSTVPTQSPPRSERDLRIAAANSHLIVVDNVSRVNDRLSDSLCRLATGGGLRIRKLYRNRAEQIFNSTRPVVLTSIEELPYRADFLDRSVLIRVPGIDGRERRTEQELWSRFNEAKPRIFCALLNAVAMALRNTDDVKLSPAPRMADFAVWCSAAEPALGLRPGEFMRAYEANRSRANEAALEASAIVDPLLDFIRHQPGKHWIGEMRQLLRELTAGAGEQARFGFWPRSARHLRAEVDRIRPNLRAAGVLVDCSRKDPETRRRIVEITVVDIQDASDASTAKGKSTNEDEVFEASETSF